MKQGNIYGKGAKAKATRLHSLIVRARGACQKCGSPGPLDCAHIVSRSYAWTRTDENNAWALCRKCHFALTNDPFAHVAFAFATIGEHAYVELRHKALQGVNVKFDWDAEVVRLRALADEMGVAA